ncbi:membrane protein DedA with SNARE-associated domain [Nonlabens dokdonensis]|uniref:Short chain dehydrogenase n=2 Tax=Nonlabens dokdonensis TaxID=328515 RepID=L7WHQ0_NONDD|nr:short-chain dehydrogenase [Nonlabens dokdonensis]AGC78523.1 short chain dehydrogenase [Nonlabens dokdonensis DSW-6]PZX38267.1 membrane protein DedA with SNARE-associated domain [Nonlabens dokdonensis]
MQRGNKIILDQSTTKKKPWFQPDRAHKYYKLTGFYTFVIDSIKKSMPPVLIVVAILAALHFFVMDINEALELAVETLPDYGVLAFFYVSETVLGLIPPELFIAWAGETSTPIINLSLIALFSYLGGFTSYWIGRRALKIPSLHNYLEVKMAKQLVMARKWGGVLIAVGALLPLPFSMASLVAGMLSYPVKSWALVGLLRFVRFALYGAAIFALV